MKSKQSPSYRESEDLGDCLFRKKFIFIPSKFQSPKLERFIFNFFRGREEL